MIFIYIVRNTILSTLSLIRIFDFIQNSRKKQIKNIILYILLYLFLNLYLFPTFALCEIDPNLLDRENNTYKGSKIVYETPDEIITQKELEEAKKLIGKVQIVLHITLFVMFIAFCTNLFPGQK